MDTLSELWVTSLDRSERRRACNLFLHFLVHYPMGKKRRQRHLGQLVAGLEYEYEEGRLAALEAIGAAIRRLPLALIEQHYESFFMALALRLANETKEKCIDTAMTVLATLLKRVSTQLLRGALDRSLAWLKEAFGQSGESSDGLRLLAARSLSAVCRSDESSSCRAYMVQQPALLNSYLNALSENLQDLTMTPNVLAVLIDAANQCCDMYLSIGQNCVSSLPENVAKCLSHSEAAPRIAASRFFLSYLQRESNSLSDILRDVARALVMHLDRPDEHFEPILGALAVDNLKLIAVRLGSDDFDWLFQRLSSMAARRGNRRRQCFFHWLDSILGVLDRSVIENQLTVLLAPLHRAVEEEDRRERERRRDPFTRSTNKEDNEFQSAVAAQAHEILRKLEDIVGAEKLASTLASLVSKMKARRTERRSKRAIQAVADPAAAARAKIERNLDKRKGKKKELSIAADLDSISSSSNNKKIKKSKNIFLHNNNTKEEEDLYHSAANLLA